MLAVMRSIFVFVFVAAFPFFVFAQDADDAAKEKLRQETMFLEQILSNGKNLRLPENRAFVYAKVASSLWQIDEKRARQLFQDSIGDLIAAQTEAETEKGNKPVNNQYLNNLIYGQSPRWDILNAIASRDAELALDAVEKTRPAKISAALANFTKDNQSPSYQYARNEIQNEQHLIALAAQQSPQRATQLLRESLKKDINYETLNLLRTIHQKDANTANQLAEEVGRRLLETQLNENNQDSSFIQYFLGEFGREQTAENATLKVSDQLLRDLAEKVAKFSLRQNSTSFYSNSEAFKVIEKFFPASAAQIKQKQAKINNQNQDAQYQNYNKLLESNASSEELLAQAEKFPRSYRNEIYRRAAEKTAQTGNIAEAQKIITSNLTDEEADRYLSQMNYNLAAQAMSKGKFDEANQIIKQIPDEYQQISALIQLAQNIYQKNPKENQKWASSILDQARALVPETPEKSSEINALLSVAVGYTMVEPEQAFRLIESLIAPLNEFSEASAVVAKFSDYGNFRQGEFQISSGNNALGAYNLTGVLQMLKTKDFERTIQFINNFSRADVRISLEIQLLDFNLPLRSSMINFNGSEDLIIKVKERGRI